MASLPPDDGRPRAISEQSWLVRHARRVLGPRVRRDVDSVDLAQEAQLELLRAERRVAFETSGKRRAWLGTVVENLARQVGRRRRPDAPGCEAFARLAGDGSTPSVRAARREDRDVLRARLDALPERTRRVVELKFVEGLSHEEIGERLGISPGNSRVVLNRGVRRLRELAGEEQGGARGFP